MSVFLYDNLSVEQRRFCALELKTPGSPCRIVVFAVRLDGKLDQNALQRAVNAIVERHSALRTVFSVEEERAIPAVLPPGPVGISEENWTHLQADEVDSLIERRIHQEYQKPFPFPAGPFLRLSLLRFAPERHLFIAAAHASVFDYPSADIFRTELLKFYEACVRGEPSSMPNYTSQEPDSGYWRRQFLAGVTKDTHLNYWKTQLSGDLANLQMPADRPRLAIAPPPSASMRITLEGAAFEAILRHSRAGEVPLRNTLLTALFILLYRYTHQEDILVGIPVTGRDTSETKGRIGRLSYPVVIRSGISGDLDFTSLLEQIGRTLSDADENGDVPFGQLREALRDSPGAEDASRHSLFQALFDCVELPEPHKAEGIAFIPVHAYHPEAEVDFAFHLELGRDRVQITAYFSKDLYEAGTIERLLIHYQNILAGALAEPNKPISQLEILSPAERRQILYEWNRTSRIYPVDIGIHRLFELQAERTPEQQALLFAGDGSSLSYAELDRRANLVARKLISLGARPETIVAISMDRSLEMIIGILGILKAGAAFLPIDPAYPKDRVIFMLTDAQAPILLTQKKYAGELSSYVHSCVCLDADWESIAGGNDTNPRVPVSDRNLAYVIYTSGSTGRPKGVMLEHRGLCNLAPIQQRLFGIRPGIRVLQFATFSFDASIWEMVMALTAGGTLVLAPSQMLLPGPYLADLLNAQKIDVVTLPPSALSVMAPEELLGVQTIIVAGEACPAELSERWSKDRKFFNAYGPTESTICATIQLCEPDHGRPPIGRPLDNVEAYIVDQSGQAVPVGVVGELCIGGIPLARGYLNRPDLSEKRFIANPFSDRGVDRLYKTGDLARWLSDGRIDYIGRADHQVKVRGYRIELEEIENVLGRHPKIREQVVIVREDTPGDKRIVAYVVIHSGETVTAKELRQYMEKYLPVFMIPSAVVFMEQMPLSPNGKVNRKALPSPRAKVKEQMAGIAPTSSPSAIAIGGKLNLPIAQEPVAPVLDYAMIERVLAQHYAVRKAVVVAHSVSGQEKQRITGYWFGRGNTNPNPGELKSYLEKKLPSELMPDDLVNVATEQERFCAIESAEPGSPLCIRVYVHRLLGALDGKAFRASVDDVVRRSSILRTTFPNVDGGAVKTIERAMTIDVEELNLSLLPESEWEGEILREVEDELSRPFNMVAGPLLRLTLLRFSRDEHVLVMASHAAIMDEHSSELFLHEVFNTYTREREERGRMVSEPPASLDESRRIRQWLHDADIATHLPYWTEVFSKGIPEMEWPQGIGCSSDVGRSGYASASMNFEPDLQVRLSELSTHEGVDLFTVLFTAYAALLYRYTGQEDLLIGTLVSGRFGNSAHKALGRYSYPIAVRVSAPGGIRFRQAIRGVAEAIAQAQKHKNIPLATVEPALSMSLERGHEKLVPAMLELKLDTPTSIDVGGIKVSRLELRHVNAYADLFFSVVSGPSGLFTRVSYNAQRFKDSAIEGMLAHWGVLLNGVAGNPDELIGKLPLLTESERHKMLIRWNDTASDYPRDKTIPGLFEEWVNQFPDAVAISEDDTVLTYEDLNRMANRVARWLVGRGIGRGSTVGLLADRAHGTIAAMLGILKAGAAYLPIDPGYPEERIAMMIGDIDVSVIIAGYGAEMIHDRIAKSVKLEDILSDDSIETRMPVAIEPKSTAYIMFTSGSTGKPKGVPITHRGIIRLVRGTNYIDFNPSDRVAHISTLSFDASTFEIWGALLNGARLVIVSKSVLLSSELFKSKLISERISIILLSTALFNQYAATIRESFQGLRYLIVGGDALGGRWAREVLNGPPPENFINAYGPTENAVISTAERILHVSDDTAIIPIGKPISNSTAYILNTFMEPVPVGIDGELYVGGDGLACGYHNRPELTAARFVKNPFENRSDEYLYQTGDRARYLPGGSIEFLGRTDDQIKIRGFRIELGEIESFLSSHEKISMAAVRAWHNRMGEKYLAAYVVRVGGTSLTEQEIRGFLSTRVPAHMVPAMILVVDSIPLTPSGKIDRKRLPEPREAERIDRITPNGASVEEALCAIWADTLGLNNVSADDDFYALGGHSLTMLRIRTMILDQFNVEIPIDVAFKLTTVQQMSAHIERAKLENTSVRPTHLLSADRSKPIPLSHFQQQLLLVLQADPSNPVYNEPITIYIREEVDADVLEQSISELVGRHEILRTVFTDSGKSAMQMVLPEQPFALGRFDLTSYPAAERESEAEKLAIIEARQPFHFSRGPLFRATLMKLDEKYYKLFLVMHHIITDGISAQQIFPRELRSIYRSISTGEPLSLPKLAWQYGDFALWQRRTKTAEALERDISYWEQTLSGASMLELPFDRPRPPVQTFKGAKFYTNIASDVIARVRNLCKQQGATTFMVVLAAFNILVSKYSGHDDIVVGTAVSERASSEFNGLIGHFVNSIVLRTDMSGNPTFREAILRIKDVALEAYAHQGVPFGMLVEELRQAQVRSHNPLFQVGLVLEPSVDADIPNWTVNQHDIDIGISKTDLTVHVEERPEHAVVRFEYSTALFDRSTIAQLAESFSLLLETAIMNPDRPVSELPILSEIQRARVLTWGKGVPIAAPQQCIHALFEEQVRRHPEKIALAFPMEQVTYADLDQRANALAAFLVKIGAGRGHLVGLCIDRDVAAIVGILGILKAGAAYVPLDPGEPTKRLEAILYEARPSIVLTLKEYAAKISMTGVEIVCLDTVYDSAERVVKVPETASGALSTDLAYVLFNAAGGGRPRGVRISHGNIASLLDAARRLFDFGENDVWAAFHSCNVDFSVWETWGALLFGGTLVGISYEVSRSLEAFYAILLSHRVTVLSQTPSAFRHLIMVEESPDVEPWRLQLRYIFLSGEVVDNRMLKPWFIRHGEDVVKIYNLYGLTAVAGLVTTHQITRVELDSNQGSNIGKPIPGAEVFILDRYLQPVPPRVYGEIYIGGHSLSSGYLGNPDMDAERFIQHPFCDDINARLYRTGDRGRFTDCGDIEFAGRMDLQVRLRGFRIDPTEIESVLVTHPLIREASVIVREDTPGDQRLVAYYVKRSDQIITTNELRAFLRNRLPDYMIPTLFIAVGAISFISNGTVDRRTLPVPDRNRPSMAPIFRLPTNAVEVLLRTIWMRLLHVDEIGVKDDFFSLGGHSLLAAQMIARVRETFKVHIQHSNYLMRAFLENPTISGFANAIEMVRDATPSLRVRQIVSINYEAEAALDSTISFEAPLVENIENPSNILLTGVTGFLGGFLLHELLARTNANIYCLVRASNENVGIDRIRKSMIELGLWDERYQKRIIAIPGDQAQLLLGLTPTVFEELSTIIDVIYHNGAHVNFIYPYSALKAANVGGTREIIRLATAHRRKPVHYLSTLAIFTGYGFFNVRSVSESTVLEHADHLFMGYPETKWVSERLLLNAANAGLPVAIYRPHDVTGHSETGVWRTEGFLCSFLKALIELQCAPDIHLPLDFAPVDFVARSVVYISLARKPDGKAYHLNNPNYRLLSWLIEYMRREGHTIDIVEHHEWVRRLLDYTNKNPSAAITPFAPLFVERWGESKVTMLEMYAEERIPRFECADTAEMLKGASLVCPPVDETLLSKYTRYFRKIGFL